jgi:alkylmercury lyase
VRADYIERATSLIHRVPGLELAPYAVRLLARGEPVELEQIASASGWPLEAVEGALDQQTSAERDEQGRLIGLALTLRPTAHRFFVDGRRLYAWCASDTLMFPVILAWPGVVESACPQTGRPIRIELSPEAVHLVDPHEAVVSAVRPAGTLRDVRTTICDHGHFFSSAAAATRWAAEHPDGYVHAVEDAFALEREAISQLGWAAPRPQAAGTPDD